MLAMDAYQLAGVALIAIPVLLIGVVAIWIGRSIFSYYRDQPAPLSLDHPTLGPLRSEAQSLWNGSIDWSGGRVPFYVAGGESGPSDSVTNEPLVISKRLNDLDRSAREFLVKSGEGSTALSDYALYEIEILHDEFVGSFTLEYEMAGDVDGIWRVEFDANQPTWVGRDD